MGLDITAVGNATRIIGVDDASLVGEDDNRCVLVGGNQFHQRMDGLEHGLYRIGGAEMYFRAGSYSTYNEFRSWLARASSGGPPSAYWTPQAEKDGTLPFLHLINFSDCEGSIGPRTCAGLAREFVSLRDKVRQSYESVLWISLYDLFGKAFAIGACDGWVLFH